MRIEVIRPIGNVKREVWHFVLVISSFDPYISLEDYSYQTKTSARCRIWTSQTLWDRHDHRRSNIPKPPLLRDVEIEVRAKITEYVATLPIKTG